MRYGIICLAGIVVWLVGGLATADDAAGGGLDIQRPWARATIGQSKNAVVYMTIANKGSRTDRLLGADSPIARRAGLHGHTMSDGIMKMRPVAAIDVAGGGAVELSPGGLHIMLMGLRAPLEEGGRFLLTLTFETAGRIELAVAVMGATAMDGPPAPGD